MAAAGYKALPIYLTLDSSVCDPLDLFCALKRLSRHCFLLESAEQHAHSTDEQRGRYTFLGFDPKVAISYANGMLEINNGVAVKTPTADPSAWITQLLEDYRSPVMAELPPLTGGLVGYFAYDYLAVVEPTLSLTQRDAEGFKDIDLMLFDRIIAYDHLKKRLLLIATIKTADLEENYALAAHELKALAKLVVNAKKSMLPPPPLRIETEFCELFSEQEYVRMVEAAKRYIHEGDIFQVVLSNRLAAPAQGSLFETYRILRTSNPSPYQFYFASDDIEMAGASPETLVRLTNGVVQTFPLAGTRPRAKSVEEDARLEQDLLRDAKELAEHNMLVDLGRNDIGKVCEFGSVEVPRYLEVLRFSHVMHIGSAVQGRLAAGKGAMDVVEAVLPAGTLSGAPKIRACQIIDELEDNRRGIYGGAIGYLGFNGNLDTCIAIRLVFKKRGKIFVRSGAGIVADSDATCEYRECRSKMAAVLEALEAASEKGK
jgi:anthranilate synthase component 1